MPYVCYVISQGIRRSALHGRVARGAYALATACMLGPLAMPAQAQPSDLLERMPADDRGTFSLMLENDVFTGKDKHYTNGVRGAWLSPESDIPSWINTAADHVPFFAEGGRRRYGLAFGQSMYTPTDITLRNPPAGERPYAGWLYGSVGLVSDTGARLDNLELTVGMVGPSSLAEQTQEFVHDLIGSPDPQGWDTQLKDELGINLTYERKWRNLYEWRPFGFGMDATPHVGGSLGNVFTHAEAGLMLRLGFDLPADYGPPRIRPSLPGSDFFQPTESIGWYVFAGVMGRAVARNIFLDGNTFKDSYSVDKEYFVGDIQLGAALTVRDTRLALTHIIRSNEYKTQAEHDEFTAVTVSYRF